MMKRLLNPTLITRLIAPAVVLILCACPVSAQETGTKTDERKEKTEQFNKTAGDIQQRLVDSQAELDALIEAITSEKSPLASDLRDLENQLKEVRQELSTISRQSANRALEEKRLTDGIVAREKAASFVSNRLDEYIREFEAGLHIAELQLYEEPLEAAKLAMENRDLSSRDRFDVQQAVIVASLQRLEDALGGVTYSGSAIDSRGVLGTKGASVVGTFLQLGPVVVFSDSTGKLQGSVEQKIGTLLPEVVPFTNPENASAVKALIESKKGALPLDTTLGEAQTIEQIDEETLEDELRAGGPVMYPIIGLAIATILVGLYKWVSITLTPSVSRRKLAALLAAVAEHDTEKARSIAKTMRGPAGKMLQAGSDHLGAPRELIEEVMYEKVLTAKLKVQRMLPFIAICAAAAPLLGLLGTVSGIINTFKMMQVSGAADMQAVSGGISEALITTKFGLIVAIPALLLHVFLSRKARGVIDKMEKAGVALINQVMKSTPPPTEGDRLAPLNSPTPDGNTPPSDPEPGTPTKPKETGQDAEAGDKNNESDETHIIPSEELEDEPVLVESSVGSDHDKNKD